MKKIKIFTFTLVLLLLSGCSFLDDVNNTIEYVNTATEHISELSAFAEEAPRLVREAANDPAVKEELETQLATLKVEIEEFINTNDVPAIAESIHEELVNKSEVVLSEINSVLENGQLAFDKLEESEILTTIHNVTDLLDRIENLGQ